MDRQRRPGAPNTVDRGETRNGPIAESGTACRPTSTPTRAPPESPSKGTAMPPGPVAADLAGISRMRPVRSVSVPLPGRSSVRLLDNPPTARSSGNGAESSPTGAPADSGTIPAPSPRPGVSGRPGVLRDGGARPAGEVGLRPVGVVPDAACAGVRRVHHRQGDGRSAPLLTRSDLTDDPMGNHRGRFEVGRTQGARPRGIGRPSLIRRSARRRPGRTSRPGRSRA